MGPSKSGALLGWKLTAAARFDFTSKLRWGCRPSNPRSSVWTPASLARCCTPSWNRLTARPLNSGDPERVLAALHQIAPQAFQTAPQNYGFRPSVLWDKQQQIWLAALEETIQASAKYDPSWKPEAYEARFGLEEVPALEIQSEAGPIWLRGVIDRIDRNPDGELRVVDYKTGGSHLTPADLINGVRLQLPLYALAAERALHLGKAAEGLYWKILKAEPGSLKLSSFNYDDAYYGVDGACELVAQHVSRFVTGIRLAEYPPEPPKGGCPRYCAAAAWCWRYSPSSY